MQKPFARWVAEYLKRSNKRRAWKSVVRMMAYVVVFCTTYALILPAITLEQQYSCGLEAHIHSQDCFTTVNHQKLVCGVNIHRHNDGCYDGEGILSCAQEDFLLHTHSHFCYDDQETLICALPQTTEHTHTEDCYTVIGHAHGDSCYTEEQGELSCQIPESAGHSHDEVCYTQTTELTCQNAETEGHTHSDDCFVWELSCEEVESEGHAHAGACFETLRTLTCEQEETTESVLTCTIPEIIRSDATQEHQHSEDCVETTTEETLSCTLEEHTHDLSCSSDPNADVETAEDWEKTVESVVLSNVWAEDLVAIAETQIGYAESEKNYLTEDNETKQGYTRYGAWYGTPYGDWDAMFASFCLHYAGIPVEAVPHASDPEKWAEELEKLELLEPVADRTPQLGDLLFFADETGTVTGVEIVVGFDMETDETGAEYVSGIKTVGGDRENEVSRGSYDPEDPSLYACCGMDKALLRFQTEYPEEAEALSLLTEETVPAETAETVPAELLTQTAETENYIVTVTYSAELEMPEGTEFRVTEYAKDSEVFRQRCEEAGYELEWLLNIGFFLGEEELDLDGAFDVVVTSKQGEALGSDITHFAESGAERIAGEDTTAEAEEGQSSVSFSADGFSDFGGGVATVAETAVTEVKITADSSDTDTLKQSGASGISEYNETYLTGKFGNGNGAYVRFNATSDYTIQAGDVATIRLKLSNVPTENVGSLMFAVQVKDADPKEASTLIPVVESDGFVTATVNLDTIANNVFNWLQLRWTGAADATMSYEIESIRIGQPAVEPEVHVHTWTASGGNKFTCSSAGDTITYTCSDCTETLSINPATLASTLKTYAESLRAANDEKTDYSAGGFTWDTEGKTWSWTYFNGVMMDAFMKVGTDEMFDYVVDFYDDVLDENGNPKTGQYRSGEVDSVPPALALFDLLGTNDATQNARYVTAIQYVYDQLKTQETLGEEYGGNFRHKDSWTTYKFGLDGIYMALPFLMEYANALDDGKLTNSTVTAEEIYSTITSRISWVASNMRDSETGLYHHGWNGSKGNGQFWGRGIGWYAVALVDIIDMMPAGSNKNTLIGYLDELYDGMLAYQDADTGMWYNVVNYDDTLTDGNGNRLETSVSAMMAYSMMKAYNEGWVDEKYYAAGLRALNGVVKNKMQSGSVVDTYKSSSVYETPAQYVTNDYTTDEAKGVGALIMAAAPDHSWSAWTVSEAVAAAAETTTAQTTETRTCSVCNETQTRTITAAEEVKTPIAYKFETVDPTALEEDVQYVIYTRPDSVDPDTYTFMFSDSNSMRAHTVTGTTYENDPVNIAQNGVTWTLTTDQMGTTDINAFTWAVEKNTDNNTVRLALQGWDNGDTEKYPGPEYLMMRNTDGGPQFGTWYSGGTNYINLTIEKTAETDSIGNAACVVANNISGHDLDLAYDTTETKWKSVATGSGTNVYFAKVTPVYEEETTEPTPTEVHDLKVLGINGPVVGKKYVIYFPYLGTDTGTNDVKFLSAAVHEGKGNYSRGVNDVEESLEIMQQAGSTWTLELYEDSGFTFEELQWTVVEVNGDLCLQSVANPDLHLKLVCTSDKGASQVNSTAYDEQGAQYFALDFTSSGDTNDSWYTVTTEDGAYELRFFSGNNQWQAITPDYEEDGVAIDATRIYFAEVVDDTTTEDPDTGTTTEEKLVGYDFTTLDPTKLTDGQIVTIYTRPDSTDNSIYTFAYSTDGVPAKTVDTDHSSNPSTVGATWDMTTAQMGDDPNAFKWQVVEVDGGILLQSMSKTNKAYNLYIANEGSASLNTSTGGNCVITVKGTAGEAASQLDLPGKTYGLYYDAENKIWTAANDDALSTIYLASVSEKYETVVVPTNYPEAVETGSPSVDTLRFYNFVESGGEHIAALPGCTFVIKGVDTDYTYTITSGENPELHLPSDIPDGSYTIEEVSSADGYLRDVNPKRSFTIETVGGKKQFVGTESIGTYLNHAQNLLGADKVAEVEDYNNRTYQVMLTADSELRMYQMNPVDVLFVVDQSNSMLFPAGLKSTGQTVNIYRNEGCTAAKNNGTDNNTSQLEALVDAGKLSKDQVYYIIADPNVTSTVYALWWNGVDWMYQDASYYAKAWHENAEGYEQDDEYAVFPDVAAYNEQSGTHVITVDGVEKEVPTKANGGSLSYEISAGTISQDILAAEAEYLPYTIYTATNGYNRLHYLQDALAHSIHQLADANSESTVTLIRFNRETLHEQCIGPWKLSPDNVQKLVEAVDAIKTDGGTRQDIALEHAYDHLMGNVTWIDEDGVEHTEDAYTKGPTYTFTVLITDGAPVGSGGDILNLGSADDTCPTNEQIKGIVTEGNKETGKSASQINEANGVTIYSSIKYWGDKVGINNYDADGQSILMTIGLGMGAVDGGAQVLGEIATGGKTGGNHLIIDDAEQLMDMLKKLLFNSMVPREKVDLMADITDVISDSYYPIAWVPEGQAPSDRKLLTMKDPQDTEKAWIILQPGDWITCEGQYVGPIQTNGDLYGIGQLSVNADGDYQITWDDQMLYDCELVWVPTKDEVPAGRQIVMTEENLDGNGNGRYWFKLQVGDYVYAHGEYVADYNNPKTGTVQYDFVNDGMIYQIVGRYVKSDGDDRAHIEWNDYYAVDFDANFQPYNWHGKFYVKAKEDFIGGNAIDTNKSAQVSSQANDGDTVDEWQGTITLETPTVNVRLLDMNQNNSEVTVYLGDIINSADSDDPLASPLDSLKDFFQKTYFEKLHADHDGKAAVMNKVATADGLESDKFYLKYAMGGLTDDQWAALAAGESVTVEYTYDNASSHGPVGYFTFQLTKTGDTSKYEAHEATDDCQVQHTHDERCTDPVETYTLHVTYTAYKLGESGRPTATVHNDTADIDGDGKGPGTEVGGTSAGTTLPEGAGIVDKDNVHKVHVISGKIEITKEITEDLKSDQDQIYTFILSRAEDVLLDENGDVVLDGDGKPVHDSSKDQTLTVTVKAGETTGTASIEHLKRGNYTVTEAASDAYSVKEILVLDTTNCYSEPAIGGSATTLLFRMGNNIADQNVISKAVTSEEGASVTTYADYTSYTGTPNGVYGAAKVVNQKTVYTGEVPVEKLWFDGNDNHADDTVLLVLYENGSPVKVDDKVQYLYLNAENDWKGTFTVNLNGPDDTVANHSYSVKEAVVTDLTQEGYETLQEDAKSAYIPLVMVSGETQTTVYAKVAEHQTVLADGDDAWFVQYGTKTETKEDGTTQTVHTVTNSPARVLPESGGMGTQMYTFSGLLCVMLAALMYGYSQRRKRERGAVE